METAIQSGALHNAERILPSILPLTAMATSEAAPKNSVNEELKESSWNPCVLGANRQTINAIKNGKPTDTNMIIRIDLPIRSDSLRFI